MKSLLPLLLLLAALGANAQSTFRWGQENPNFDLRYFEIEHRIFGFNSSGHLIIGVDDQYSTHINNDTFLMAVDTLGNTQAVVRVEEGNGPSSDMENPLVSIGPNDEIFTAGKYSGSVDLVEGVSTSYLDSTGTYVYYLAKHNALGAPIWTHSFDSAHQQLTITDILAAPDGGVYATGLFVDTFDTDLTSGTDTIVASNPFAEFVLIKFNSTGAVEWRTYAGSEGFNASKGHDLSFDADGNLLVSGIFWGSVRIDATNSSSLITGIGGIWDGFIAKYNPNGTFMWAKPAAVGAAYKRIHAMVCDSDNNVYIAGFTGTGTDFDPSTPITTYTYMGGSSDMFIAKYDENGNYLWVKLIGGSGTEAIYSMTISPDSMNIIVAGYFNSTVDFDPGVGTETFSAQSEDGFFAVYDLDGNYVCAQQIGGSLNQRAFDVTVDANGKIYVIGEFYDLVDFYPAGSAYTLYATDESTFLASYDCGLGSGIVTSAEDKTQNLTDINVYPNPFEDYTTFAIGDYKTNETYQLELYDISGKLVKTVGAITSKQFNLSSEGLNNGIYFYSIYSGDRSIGMGKLVVR